tara:strand:- start:333 stop:749 length:417 start_codon:yes stop_codon:yes gene_type:complete
MKVEIIEIIISELDFFLIQKVKELRTKPVYISQMKLSQYLDQSEGYIGKVENFKERSKYNIRMLNKLAQIFQLNSYAELLPSTILKNDIVRIRLKIHPDPLNKRKKVVVILSKKSLTDEEMIQFKKNRLPYLKIIESN